MTWSWRLEKKSKIARTEITNNEQSFLGSDLPPRALQSPLLPIPRYTKTGMTPKVYMHQNVWVWDQYFPFQQGHRLDLSVGHHPFRKILSRIYQGGRIRQMKVFKARNSQHLLESRTARSLSSICFAIDWILRADSIHYSTIHNAFQRHFFPYYGRRVGRSGLCFSYPAIAGYCGFVNLENTRPNNIWQSYYRHCCLVLPAARCRPVVRCVHWNSLRCHHHQADLSRDN